ncbi:MAG: Sua5/YciO/YrdC/YwlC family protein, partial [Oscillospiraceae bacterium]
METKVLVPIKENIEYVANLLRQGEVCGIPTETVYGLAANAYDEKAVEKIFKAKGRPQDNPLIVHICSLDMLKEVVDFVPSIAYDLAKKFWPG